MINIKVGQVYQHPRYQTQVEIVSLTANCATIRFLEQPDKTDVHALKGIRTWHLVPPTEIARLLEQQGA